MDGAVQPRAAGACDDERVCLKALTCSITGPLFVTPTPQYDWAASLLPARQQQSLFAGAPDAVLISTVQKGHRATAPQSFTNWEPRAVFGLLTDVGLRQGPHQLQVLLPGGNHFAATSDGMLIVAQAVSKDCVALQVRRPAIPSPP